MKKQINIQGMSCGNCARHVKNALLEVSGVSDATVYLSKNYAVAELSSSIADERLIHAIEEAGYCVTEVSEC